MNEKRWHMTPLGPKECTAKSTGSCRYGEHFADEKSAWDVYFKREEEAFLEDMKKLSEEQLKIQDTHIVEPDVRKDVDPDIGDKILSDAVNQGYDTECFEGVLQDNYVIYNHDRKFHTKHLEDCPDRNFIIIREKYVNIWSSCHELIFTDNEDMVSEFIEKMREDEEE